MAFCSGGDQRIRGDDGYIGDDAVANKGIGRLNVLDLQIQIRRTPKPVVAMVAGYAIGGGHVLHVVCDLTIAADNARFGQTGPRVGSFDGGYGSGLLARNVGQKKAREIWFLCRQYDAQQALDMGLVNTVVPLAELEERRSRGAARCCSMSPIALRMMKASMNAADDGLAGIQQLAGDATLLFYMTEEAQEGRDAYVEKRTAGLRQVPTPPVARRTRSHVNKWVHRGAAAHAAGGGRAGARRHRVPRVGVAAGSSGGAPVAAMVVALAIQVGTNYANDYSDGVRGTDDAAGRARAPRRPAAWRPRRGEAGRVRVAAVSPRSAGARARRRGRT